MFTAQGLLTEQIRAELSFESPPFPNVTYVAPEAFSGAITELAADKPPGVRQAPRLRNLKREESAHKFDIELPGN